jgi:cysteine synthase B
VTAPPNTESAGRQPAVGDRLLDCIGNTPLLRLDTIGRDFPQVLFLAKAEWYNPGGSVKDRAAAAMVRDAEERGLLTPERQILDATSGNTGIALAMIAAARGYRVRLCLPSNVSPERIHILRAYGADLVLTSPDEGSDGAIRRARELQAEEPQRYCYLDQYSNPANWKAHYQGTAEEIWRQTQGRLTHFVATLGTSGTFVGTTRRLRELNPRVQCVSAQPDSPFHGLEGLKHMATAMRPEIYEPALADKDIGVGTEAAYAMVKRLAREEGLLVGISSGAALAACFSLAASIESPAIVVTVFPDNADKYLSERFWHEV